MQEGSPRKAHSGKLQESRQQLEELLSCQICYCRAIHPTLCPHCSKLYCEICLMTSLRVKAECPNCRRAVKGPLPQCGRFVGQLAALVQAVVEGSQETERCSEHGIGLNYFCQDCRRSACCECKMFGAHQQHRFAPISQLYEHKYQKIRDLLSELRNRIVEQEHSLTEVENQLIGAKAKTEAHLLEIEEHTQKYRQKMSKESGKEEEGQDVEVLTRQYNEFAEIKQALLAQLEHAKRVNCYRIDQELLDRLEALLFKNSQRSQHGKSVSPVEEAMPPLQLHKVLIDDYSKRKAHNQPFFSQPVEYEGSKWRLVVYISGNTNKHCLSAFLELLTNPDSLNLYLYHIQLLHPLAHHAAVMKEHHARFNLNECVGYGKFIKNEELEAKQFVQSEQDTLTFAFGVRFCTYYDLYARRQTLLNQLDCQIQAKQQRIEDIQGGGRHSEGSIDLQ